MPEQTSEEIQEIRSALGWAPADGPEEQAANARMGGQVVQDEGTPAPVATPPVPPVTPSSAAVTPEVTPTPPPAQMPKPAYGISAEQDTQMRNKANQEAQTYKQQLIANSWEEQAAHHAAGQYASSQYNAAKATHFEGGLEQQARSDTATHFGQQYGVDSASLVGYDTPAQMEAAAKAQQATNTRITALEKQTSAPAPVAKTPVQGFDSGEGGGQTQQARKIAYATGQINLNTKEFKELFHK